MHVVATAGHVDHGKSALVRALTGMEPDRWEQERARGLTIDLGYAWTTLPSGRDVAFVDVPGHRRFIGNMLAGLGPAPVVLLVVAADEGWRQQSAEHLAAIDALGLDRGLLAVTRTDLADPQPAIAQAREALASTPLRDAPTVTVSARTGAGLEDLRAALDDVLAALPPPRTDGRIRLWIDRSFTIAGAGTVVTGTLGAGTLAVGDTLELRGERVRVRGLQSLEVDRDTVAAVARVAVNLRGVRPDAVTRQDALLTPGAWRLTDRLDARLADRGSGGGEADADLPEQLMLHAGTAAVPVRRRPLAGGAVRLTLTRPLPLVAGDRAILRDPADHTGRGMRGIIVADVDPPALRRRGDAARRGHDLATRPAPAGPDLGVEVGRRWAMRAADAASLGVDAETVPAGVRRYGDWLVAESAWTTWLDRLGHVVAAHAAAHPLDPHLPLDAARRAIGVPDPRLLPPLAEAGGLVVDGGRVHQPGVVPDLGPVETGCRRIEERLATDPFAAPERGDLDAAGLGERELAAAQALGRLIRLGDGVVLLPSGPPRAMRVLAGLPQPFTTSQARQALATTRRVVIPLLEHLDSRGWTRRLDAGHREVVR